MATITALETQKHDPERVNVFLDGEFAFGAPMLLVAARGLRPGRELDDAQVQELRREDGVERAYGAALNFLSFRPRSRREMRDYFRRKKTEEEVVEEVLARLEANRLLDDREFARYWVENRQIFRPRGTMALRMEMRQKGLERDVIDEALAEVEDEEAVAHEAGRKKVRTFRHLDDREFFRRMVGFLQRRGFPYDVAAKVTRLLAEECSDGPE